MVATLSPSNIPKNAVWTNGEWKVPGPSGRMVKFNSGPDITIEIEVGSTRSRVEQIVLADIRAFEEFARGKGYDLNLDNRTGSYLNYVTQVAWQSFYAGRKGAR